MASELVHDVLTFGTAAVMLAHQLVSWHQRREMKKRLWRVEASNAQTIDVVRSLTPSTIPTPFDPNSPTPPLGLPGLAPVDPREAYARQKLSESTNPYLKVYKPPGSNEGGK